MQIVIDVKESAAEKILYFLRQCREDVRILQSDDDFRLEEIEEGSEDHRSILEARKAREAGEKLYTVDEIFDELEKR